MCLSFRTDIFRLIETGTSSCCTRADHMIIYHAVFFLMRAYIFTFSVHAILLLLEY